MRRRWPGCDSLMRWLACLASGTVVFLAGHLGADATVRSPLPDAIRESKVFEEPLIPIGVTSEKENLDLSNAIRAYRQASSHDDLGVFERFLTAHPISGWRVPLLTNLGLAYYHFGYF